MKTKNSSGEDSVAYYHPDHLGTPLQATDKAGRIVWAARYEAFGRATLTTPAATAEAPVIVSRLRLPGQYEDEESGLYYNFRRYYDPETGRYTTRDPIGLEGGVNGYAYVGGNPLGSVDPNGLSALGDAGAFLGGWGGRVGGAAAGEAVFPAGGGVPGAIIGGRLGAWGGRAAGEWLNDLIFSAPPLSPADEAQKDRDHDAYHNTCDKPEPPI